MILHYVPRVPRNKNRTRTIVAAGCAVLCLGVGQSISANDPNAAPAPTSRISLGQGRSLAVQALRDGKPELAIEIARALWDADKRDSATYAIIATAYSQMDQHKASRKAAAQAYRFTKVKPDRLQMAELAARSALREGRPTLTQIWLRRAAINTNDENATHKIAQDYGKVRHLNPWSFRLFGSLRPSDNVNTGSESGLQIIDGVPYVGRLSGSDQALSGLVSTIDTAISYRLRATDTSSTSIGTRIYVKRVALSNAAKTLATPLPNPLNLNPTTPRNAEFGSTFAEISLKHRHKVAGSSKNAVADYGLAFGGSWYGHNTNYYFGRVSAGRRWAVTDNTQLSLHGAFEVRDVPSSTLADSTVISVTGGVTRRLTSGDTLRFTLNLAETDSDSNQRRYKSASARADYHFKDTFGPKALNAKLSAGLTAAYSDYEAYGFFPIAAPGGRQETSVYADVTAVFQNIDYAGFVPAVTVRAGRKSSNVSRFNTKELSVSLGIQSKF
jgi:hypothetical protein